MMKEMLNIYLEAHFLINQINFTTLKYKMKPIHKCYSFLMFLKMEDLLNVRPVRFNANSPVNLRHLYTTAIKAGRSPGITALTLIHNF